MKTCPQKHENPDNAQFCRYCGYKFAEGGDVPFFMAHPEYHLRPFSEFEKISMVFNKPDYMEDPKLSTKPDYYYIAKDGKIGIIYWHYKNIFNNTNRIVIKCKYDHIEKKDGMFICHNDSEKVYIDLKGNILK